MWMHHVSQPFFYTLAFDQYVQNPFTEHAHGIARSFQGDGRCLEFANRLEFFQCCRTGRIGTESGSVAGEQDRQVARFAGIAGCFAGHRWEYSKFRESKSEEERATRTTDLDQPSATHPQNRGLRAFSAYRVRHETDAGPMRSPSSPVRRPTGTVPSQFDHCHSGRSQPRR
ncbi:hypothetical protein D3C87_1135130 [compost metagenome]